MAGSRWRWLITHGDEPLNVAQTLGVYVCREIVAWEDDFDRDVGDLVGLPKRAVGPMPFLVVENRAAGLVALGLDVNALDDTMAHPITVGRPVNVEMRPWPNAE